MFPDLPLAQMVSAYLASAGIVLDMEVDEGGRKPQGSEEDNVSVILVRSAIDWLISGWLILPRNYFLVFRTLSLDIALSPRRISWTRTTKM